VISVDREFGAGKVDAVHPSISIVAENPVAVVERTTSKKGSGELRIQFFSLDEFDGLMQRIGFDKNRLPD
jgi:ABC-type sulfate transport system substrate-binding protein